MNDEPKGEGLEQRRPTAVSSQQPPADNSPYEAPAHDPQPVAMGAPQAPALPYPKHIFWDALSYPFRGWGALVFFVTIFVAAIIGVIWPVPILGWMAGLIVWAVIVGMCAQIMMYSINRPERLPDWPDFSDAGSELVVPLLRFVLGWLLCLFLPLLALFVWKLGGFDEHFFVHALVYLLFEDKSSLLMDETRFFAIILLTSFLGSVYLAFSMLTMSFLGTWQGLMPQNVLVLFWKSMPQSWYIVPLLLLLTISHVSVEYLSAIHFLLPFLLVAPVNVYFFMVIARFLGRLYSLKEQQIGWFV